jgi:HEAT repeat protein
VVAPRLDSPDWRERLRAAQDLGRSQAANPGALEALLRALRDEEFAVAYEASRSLALLGDRSVLPRLLAERQAAVAATNPREDLVDTSGRSVEPCLTQAIVSLLTPAECDALLEAGREDEKWFIRRRRSVASMEEFWGPLRG